MSPAKERNLRERCALATPAKCGKNIDRPGRREAARGHVWVFKRDKTPLDYERERIVQVTFMQHVFT